MGTVPPLPDDVLELGQSLIPQPIFLVGCARSGTSILGEAVAEHPRITYLFEASSIWNELVPSKQDHRLVASDATADNARSIYEALAKTREEVEKESPYADGKPDILLEKNPKHVIRIPFLAALFPRAKFLHIIRDGRDTTVSLMFRNRGNRWGHLEVPGWRKLLERYPEEHHIRCAHQWRDSVTIAREDARSLEPGRYREIRYEDLLAEPGTALEGLLAFLGLAMHPRVQAFLPKIQDATAGSYHARKQIRHYVDNHSRRRGRYLENLSPEQIRDVEQVCGPLLRELGYQ